jgi:ComF family protein
MGTATGLVKSEALRPLRWLGGVLLDTLYPPACLSCDAPVGSADALCTDCFKKLRAITDPMCPVLGIPFEVSLGPGVLSAEAIADPPPYDRSRSAVIYNAAALALVGKLKYGDRPELARFCARLMAQAGHELLVSGAVLVPVPLHRTRQFARRYNQSAELARALSALTGLAVDTGLVRRKKATRQQVGLSGEARRRNVAGAFEPFPGAHSRLAGRRVIIVDDVITTGATVAAVTRALKAGGATGIDVLSFARVVIGRD